MGVSKFTQPDYATQGGAVYPTAIDDAVAVMKRFAAAFAPHESDPLALTVEVDAGPLFAAGTLIEVAAQTTAAFVAPAADPRIDRIVVDATTGTVEVAQGAEAAAPVAPSIPAGKLPVCQVALTVGMTEITNADLTDERVGTGGGDGLNPGTPTELTIDTGAVTVAGGYHTVDTEADAAADDLDTIDATALPEGGVVIFRAENAARVPTFKNGTDNLNLRGDCALDGLDKRIALQKRGAVLDEVFRSPAAPPLLHVRDEKSSGTDGGASSTTTWIVRDLNTVVQGGIAGASLSANQVTLPAGAYDVEAWAPAFKTNHHRLALHDGSAFLLQGTNSYARETDNAGSMAVLGGRIALAAETTLELQHFTKVATSQSGLGPAASTGQVEVYAEVIFRKVG